MKPITDRTDFVTAAEQSLNGHGAWFRDWVAHPDRRESFWSAYNAAAALDSVQIPIRLVGGWQDVFLGQALHQYDALSGRGIDVGLTLGPWKHSEVGTKGAGIVTRGALDWLATHLADDKPSASGVRSVDIFVTGADEWREMPQWPPATTPITHTLTSSAGLTTDTRLDVTDQPSTFVYDPSDPTPSIGGRVLTADGGVKDNRGLESRSDILAFSSEVLSMDLEIAGSPIMEMTHSSDNPNVDVFLRLCDVDPSGKSVTVSDAFARLTPAQDDQPRRLDFRFDPCAHRFAAGHRIRVLIGGGAHPRYAFNPGTGAPVGTSSPLRSATHHIHTGQSRLILPTVLNDRE